MRSTTFKGSSPARGRAIWRNLHRWLALLVALPVLTLAVTGILLAFASTWDRLQYPQVFNGGHVAKPLSLVSLVAALKVDDPSTRIAYLALPEATDRPVVAFVNRDSGFAKLFMHPGTGLVLQVPESQFSHWVERLHRAWLLPDWGRYLVAASSLILLGLSLVGLYLWWPMRKRTVQRALQRRTALAWHNLVGVALAPLLVILALTGVTLTFHKPLFEALYSLTEREPVEPPPALRLSEDQVPIALTVALEQAQKALPQARLAGYGAPKSPGDWFRFRFQAPSDLHPTGWHHVWVNPLDASTVTADIRTAGAVALYQAIWYPLHTGELFGAMGAWLWSLGMVLLVALTGTGLWRWYRGWRRPRA